MYVTRSYMTRINMPGSARRNDCFILNLKLLALAGRSYATDVTTLPHLKLRVTGDLKMLLGASDIGYSLTLRRQFKLEISCTRGHVGRPISRDLLASTTLDDDLWSTYQGNRNLKFEIDFAHHIQTSAL